ncbi:Uncharacterised protein g8901 [Pycnogonum litorale]
MALNERSTLLGTTKENSNFTIARIRYLMAFLCWSSLVCSFTTKLNISIAIVDMVSTSDSDDENWTFDWNSKIQGLILSSFFWGYAITQVPGGVFASRYGTKICLTFGTLTNVLLSVLTPICTVKGGAIVLISIRFVGGLCLGLTFPCYVVFWSKWSPTLERSRLLTLTYSGTFCGPLLTFVVGGPIVQRIGWDYMFYATSLIGFVWTILWLVFASDTPEDNRFISQSERTYIVENRGDVRRFLPVQEIPWKHLLTSLPFLSIVSSCFCHSWGIFTMMTQLPTYMKRVFGFDTMHSGVISGAPYGLQAIAIVIVGYLSDYVIKRSIVSTKIVRRFCVCFGATCQAIFFVLIANIESAVATVTFLMCGASLDALVMSGYHTNLLDIAPNIVGPMMGITNLFGSLAYAFAPLVSGLVVEDQSSFDQWSVVFYITAGFYATCCLSFGFTSAGEELDWNRRVSSSQADDK